MVLNKHSFYAEDIQSLQKLIDQNDLKLIDGEIINQDIKKDYNERLLQNINLNKKIKIAWDIGNGAMGAVIK